MKACKIFANLLAISMLTISSVFSLNVSATPAKITAAGDSITMAFAADCKYNRYFWDLFCLLGGDQPKNSWFDGSNRGVTSIHDRYKQIDPSILANKAPAESGSEMRGGSNPFITQAQNMVTQSPKPDHVEVLLGGNDICNRGCTDPANCDDPLYTDDQWRGSIQAGLDVLMNGLDSTSTVYLLSVPRVQDLRPAGLAKQASSRRINCERVWSTFNICNIATQGSHLNGESLAQRLAAVRLTQKRYNEIILEEATAYNTNSNSKNPKGIEVITDYVNESSQSIGTYVLGADDIDGGDCFHPSIAGQNFVSDYAWQRNTDR